MGDIQFFFTILIGISLTTLITWLILHFNGKILVYLFSAIKQVIQKKQNLSIAKSDILQIVSEGEILIIGLTPLAIASIVSSSFGFCLNSLKITVITELILFFIFLTIPHKIKKSGDFWGKKVLSDHKSVVILAFVWCFIFGVWAVFALPLNERFDIDRIVVNTNPDIWAYVRRYAAFSLENIDFDNNYACYYLQISPKKLSSFLGSIINSLSPDVGLGIIFYEGALGCSLFICLFKDWLKVPSELNVSTRLKYILGIFWALSAPSIYWLIVSSYLSNALVIIVLCLGLRVARNMGIENKIKTSEFSLVLFCFIVTITSFYLVFLKIALVLFIITGAIYAFQPNQDIRKFIKQQLSVVLIALVGVFVCYLLFRNLFTLEETQKIVNPFIQHARNYVPLNPWSLVQETPKRMSQGKDLGVWINVFIGVTFASFLSWKVWQVFQKNQLSSTTSVILQKDLIAGLMGLIMYIVYLLAYIPLTYTYHLGKFAITVLSPLAIFGLFPLASWLWDKISFHQSKIVKILALTLVGFHVIFHFNKTFSILASVSGQYILNTTGNLAQNSSIAIVACKNAGVRGYEIMAGFRLAKQYPNLDIHVIGTTGDISKIPPNTKIINGFLMSSKKREKCVFDIEL